MTSKAGIRPLSSYQKIFVTGHSGLVGSAIVRALKTRGLNNILTVSSQDLDLTNRDKVFEFLEAEGPDLIFHAAGRVGGIHANNTYPAEFLSQNLQIQLNVMDAANAIDCDRLIFLGSSCIYPKLAPQPIHEAALLTGHLEVTNDAYAIAKIAGIKHVHASRRQYGRSWVAAMPCNLYGPGDNYDPMNSHFLPALIRRYETARVSKQPVVENWGSGSPLREVLYVDDLANALLVIAESYDEQEIINVGSGIEMSLLEYAQVISQAVGFQGKTIWDSTRPDGTPRKVLNNSKIFGLGWMPEVDIKTGITRALTDFRSRADGDMNKSEVKP